MEIPLAGPHASQQGRLVVQPVEGVAGLDGSATLGGTLRLVFQDGYVPAQGDSCTLVEAASTNRAFDSVEVAGLEEGLDVDVTIENGGVVVDVVDGGGNVAAEPPASELPARFALHQNYPNPFNPETTIAFDLPTPSHVRLTVYDLLGRRVAVPVEGLRAAGVHRVTFGAADLPSGVYMYWLEAGTFTAVRTMLLAK